MRVAVTSRIEQAFLLSRSRQEAESAQTTTLFSLSLLQFVAWAQNVRGPSNFVVTAVCATLLLKI